MGVVEVWLTFESDGWHSDSSVGECGDFEEGESGEFVGWFVGCAHSGYDDVGFEAWVGRSLVMRKRLTAVPRCGVSLMADCGAISCG
jgi:hypothetical protein